MAWIEPDPDKTPASFKGPWYARARIDGQRTQRTNYKFWTLVEARAARAKLEVLERQTKRGQNVGRAGRATLVLFDLYLKEEQQAGVIGAYSAYKKDKELRPYLEKFPNIQDLSDEAIEILKTDLLTKPCVQSLAQYEKTQDPSVLKPYNSSSVSIKLRALKTFLRWCRRKSYISHVPMEYIRMPKTLDRRDLLRSLDDLEKLIDSAATPRFRLFLVFLLFQGLRKGMTRQALGEHISNGMWTIPKEHAKVPRDITVALHPRTIQELKTFYPNGIPKGPLFGKTFAHRIAGNSRIWEYWVRTKKKANLGYHISMHGARRTWATHFMKYSQSLPELMAAGHWLDVKTAMKYQHLASEWMAPTVQGFDYAKTFGANVGEIGSKTITGVTPGNTNGNLIESEK